ncbi:helix-turn-helix domain-containing protein [Streptomyces sp. NPDC001536]|uniref:helix-turn-helix domain-containing protein n=1 Tax=Streptomyces sp. NPDC001536 TaxID=3364583 RepID=UPI0036D1319C
MLSDEERAELLRWVGGAVAPRLVERARIVLACADGQPNTRVAAELKVTTDTARKWRSRLAARPRLIRQTGHPHTLRGDASSIKNHVLRYWGGWEMRAITRMDIQSWIRALVGKSAGASAIKRAYNLTSSMSARPWMTPFSR